MTAAHADATTSDDPSLPDADPDTWRRVYSIVTREPCPTCGTALGLLVGPTDAVDDVATKLQADHDGCLPDTWSEDYDHPVYLYCYRPACDWQAAADWTQLRPVLEVWLQHDAPTWRELHEPDATDQQRQLEEANP